MPPQTVSVDHAEHHGARRGAGRASASKKERGDGGRRFLPCAGLRAGLLSGRGSGHGRARLQPLSVRISKVPGNRQRRSEPSRTAGSLFSLQISCSGAVSGRAGSGSCSGGSYLSRSAYPMQPLKFTILVFTWLPS